MLNEFPDVFSPLPSLAGSKAVELVYLQLTLLSSISFSNNDIQEEMFERMSELVKYGNNTSIDSIIFTAEPRPSLDTVIFLFDLMFDSHRWVAKELYSRRDDLDSVMQFLLACPFRPRIYNRFFIPTIMSIAKESDIKITKFILALFLMLVDENAPVINIATCLLSDQSLFDIILDQLPSYDRELHVDAALLLRTLGKHSISVSQLKKIFRTIQSRGKYCPPYTSLLLRSLKAMMVDKREPRQFFILEGVKSGLMLPSIRRWPATKAFSFTIWMKVESHRYDLSYADETSILDSLVYTPYVLNLRTDKKAGFEILLTKINAQTGKFRLVIKSYNSSGESFSLSPP
jgi:hypothetical protein